VVILGRKGEFIEYTTRRIGTSVFWLLFTLIAVIGLFYMFLLNYNTSAAIIYTLMLAVAWIVELTTIVNMWGKNNVKDYTVRGVGSAAFGYVMGNLVFLLISLYGFSIGTSSILSIENVGQAIPKFWEFFIDVFTSGFIEESFWLLTIPLSLWIIFNGLEKPIPFLKPKAVKLGLIILISSLSFAFFHVSMQGSISFLISAMIFRALFVFFYWGDLEMNVVEWTAIPPSFMVGAHQMNNWLAKYGFMNGIHILVNDIFGWFIILWFLLCIYLSLRFLKQKIRGEKVD